MAEHAVRFDEISKSFPGVLALDRVSLEITAGSCHALCGENGAGKSSLGKILAGIYVPDSGRIFVEGREVSFGSPRDALAAGVGMVHQELAFCESLSVAENLCLGAIPARGGVVVWRREMERRAEAMLAEIGSSLDVRQRLGELSIAQQQMVQIATAIGSGARIIVFDEPTASLSQDDVERLFALIQRLKQRGVTCIYVSHRLGEIFRICDAVSVLRDGRHVATRPIADVGQAELVRLMIGRPLAEYFPQHLHTTAGEELLLVESLTSEGKFEDISFSLRAGEIVGLAGLVGAGRSELAAALFGLASYTRGRIILRGREVRFARPADAIRAGIGLVPEDRKHQGLVMSESGLHNTSLPILKRLSRFAWVRAKEERSLAQDYFGRLRVRTPSVDATVSGLSGGNQQKIVLARWLAAMTQILILDEPTRGVDVGAKAELHALIDQLAARGNAVLLISSELPEIINLSTRILVLRERRLVGEVPRSAASPETLLRLMADV